MITMIASHALAAGTFDPSQTVSRIRAVLILLLGVSLLIVSVVAVFGAGRRGNNAKAANIASASVISLIPAAIAVVGALAVGSAFFGWAVPGFGQ